MADKVKVETETAKKSTRDEWRDTPGRPSARQVAALPARRPRHGVRRRRVRRRRPGPAHPTTRPGRAAPFPPFPPLPLLPFPLPLPLPLLVLEPHQPSPVDPSDEIRPAFGFPTDAVRGVPVGRVLRQDREWRPGVVRRELERRWEERFQRDDLGAGREFEEEPREAFVQRRGEAVRVISFRKISLPFLS